MGHSSQELHLYKWWWWWGVLVIKKLCPQFFQFMSQYQYRYWKILKKIIKTSFFRHCRSLKRFELGKPLNTVHLSAYPFRNRHCDSSFTDLLRWFGRTFYARCPPRHNPTFYPGCSRTQTGWSSSGPLGNEPWFPMCQSWCSSTDLDPNPKNCSTHRRQPLIRVLLTKAFL